MKKTLVASITTVTLGKITVTKDHPLAQSGCVAIAEFGRSTRYGFGATCSEALEDLIIRHRIQIHEIDA